MPIISEHPTNNRSGSGTFGFSGYLYNDLSHQIKANQSREWFPAMMVKNHKCQGKRVSLDGETWRSKDLLVKKSSAIYIRFCGHFVAKGLRKIIAGLSCCNSISICRKDALEWWASDIIKWQLQCKNNRILFYHILHLNTHNHPWGSTSHDVPCST